VAAKDQDPGHPPALPLDGPDCAATRQGGHAGYRSLFAEMLIEEARDLGEHLLDLGRVRVEIVLGVRHALVDLQFGLDARAAQLAVRSSIRQPGFLKLVGASGRRISESCYARMTLL
jgi:hypothetical protein